MSTKRLVKLYSLETSADQQAGSVCRKTAFGFRIDKRRRDMSLKVCINGGVRIDYS